MKSKRSLRIAFMILALVVLAALSSKAQVDPGIADTLRIDSVVAYTDGVGIVPIRIYNDQALSAVEVTLKYNSADITFDSVSFVGTRLESAGFLGGQALGDTAFSFFATFSSTLLPIGSGIAANAFFSFDPGIAPQLVSLDTVTVVQPGPIRRSTEFQDTTTQDQPYIPQFVPGYIDIQTPPASIDSLWVTGATGAPGDDIAIDVSFFNEENVKDLTVVLDYASPYLVYDSISFAGTRGASAPQKQITPNSSVHKVAMVLTYGDAMPLTPGSGTLARLYFSISMAAADTVLTIDSSTLSNLTTIVSLTSAEGGLQFVPFFTADTVGIHFVTDVGDDPNDGLLPDRFVLQQNYPNPFNPSTTIEFSLPVASEVRIDIFNILGQRVTTLLDQYLPAGDHSVVFDAERGGSRIASGVYFYRLSSRENIETKKMLLVK